jgi:LPXTG-site transpeptidase (sortase) family protein
MPRLSIAKLKTGRDIGWLLIIFGIVLAVVCVILLVHQKQTEPKPPPAALTSKSAPSSIKLKPQVVASYNVPPNDPKYIAIPAIGIANTPILKLGLTSSGQINVPDNIYDTGWYDGSSEPGQAGAMFIYGHVSSWTANGIFYNLKKLVLGDQITITRGDNTTYTYQVVSSKVYPYNNVNMSEVLAPITSNKAGLNLMTCTGQIIKGTSEFNERLVVFTSLVSA